MKIFCDTKGSETVEFAAAELQRYLERMLPVLPGNEWAIRLAVRKVNERAISKDGSPDHPRGSKEDDLGIEYNFLEERKETRSTAASSRENDEFYVRIGENGGCICGNCDRSVLLGVYDYLHYLGCRFLMPGAEGERIPTITKEQLCADYSRRASFYHRGVCIEGADSFENIRDFIDWLPKVGCNSFFLQFKVPYTFLARWYHHEKNPDRAPEVFTYEDAKVCMKLLETEISRRGLLLHKVGHGWTGEVLGYQTASWDTVKEEQAGNRDWAAMLNGTHRLFRGIPADTNLCFHNADAADRFAELVVQYAEENPQIDYLHIWLADEYNNVCECSECQKTTLSDQYVELLNEIDRRLTEKKQNTRLVFLLYQELLWPPIKARLNNPDRFVLMFAPISRTFEQSYSLEQIPDTLPEYRRNQIELPTSLGENLAYLKGWQNQFAGDSFVYDYPLGRAHYGDFGYIHIAKVIYEDIQKIEQMGLNGYISCQELRAALPNALPNYVMGYTLFSKEQKLEELVDEYMTAAYQDQAVKVKEYLTRLSELSSCDYLNGKGSRRNEAIRDRMRNVMQMTQGKSRNVSEDLLRGEDYISHDKTNAYSCNPAGNLYSGTRTGFAETPEDIFWKMLDFHREYIHRLSEAMAFLADGETERAMEKWKEMRTYLCSKEPEYQPYLDVYRILEVTQKYTGFTEQ